MKASFLLAVVLSLGTSAHPQSEHIKSNSEIEKGLPLVYQKWLTEDVSWIIKPDDRVSFLRLSSDAERDDFARQFWLRRDPTPGTEENEFKEEHYRRLAYANQHFAHTISGWKTDRGRIYIVYEPPDRIDSKVGHCRVCAFSRNLALPVHAGRARADFRVHRYL